MKEVFKSYQYCIHVICLGKVANEILIFFFFSEMQQFFMRSRLYYLLQTLEIFIVQISNSDHRVNFVSFGENFTQAIYRAARDFTETLFFSSFSIVGLQTTQDSERTILVLQELNSILITWQNLKESRKNMAPDFIQINEEQKFIQKIITAINALLRFKNDFERFTN